MCLMETVSNKDKSTAGIADSPDLVMDKDQVAGRLKISVRTLENWMAAGDIPFWRRKKLVRFYWPDVEAHLRRQFGIGYPPGVSFR